MDVTTLAIAIPVYCVLQLVVAIAIGRMIRRGSGEGSE